MAEALDKIKKPPICLEPQPLKSCLKPTNTKQESDSSSLGTSIGNTFSCEKFSHLTPAELPKHVHFYSLQVILYIEIEPPSWSSILNPLIYAKIQL